MNISEHPLASFATYAARMLAGLSGGENALLTKVVEGLSQALENGGTCAEVSDFGPADEVKRTLLALPVVGGAGEERPLVIDKNRIYFQRYHAYETHLADGLLNLAGRALPVPEGADALAARLLSHGLGIVTGGPGTGKTTLASRLLALLAASAKKPLSVALAAPTGKAAARLAESVRGAGACPGLTLTHGTVHRLLGPRPGSVYFRHDAAHPLLFDVVVLDESSMMDLPLIEKLVDAIDPERTRLLLLGDPDQLPSIYSGSALTDIVDAAERGGPLAECFIRLTTNHRSGDSPELAALVDAVRSGDAPRALSLFGGSLLMERPPKPEEMRAFVARTLTQDIHALSSATRPGMALDAAARHRLVCMLRQGPCGAEAVNTLALDLARSLGLAGAGERYFHGMPVIVTRNEHHLNLFNGDSGVIFRHGNQLRAYFENDGALRSLPVRNLPPCEPAYALTVHRGQGSEYESVTLLLPPEDHPLLTRELFYTGVSRARRTVRVAGTPELLARALARKERRASGLADRLA